MKKLIAFLMCIVCILAMAACSSDKEPETSEIEEGLNSLADFLSDTTENAIANSGNETAEPVDPKTVDYSKIDAELGFEDGSKMPEFMNDIQAGKYDNKVIKITGIMSTSVMDPKTNSVMLDIGDGVKQGFSWRIVDANENTEFPGDDHKIELTGVMISEFVQEWGWNAHYLYVLPENVKDLGYPED